MQNAETAIGAKNQEQDGTIIVPNEALQAIIEKYELEKEDADKLQKSLSGGFALFEEWKAKNSELVVDRADQVAEMTKASEGAKAMQKARTGFVKDWQAIKAPYLKTTQALDAINRFVTTEVKALESELQEKANVGARLAQAEKDLLIANRKAALIEVGHNGEIPGLGEMSEETFEMILGGAKEKVRLQREQEAREAADREAAELAAKQETERLANLEKTINARVLKLVEIGAKRNIDPNEYLFLGDVLIYVESLGVLQDESFTLLVGEFQAEADRLKQIEADRLALVQRTQDRRLQLVQMGAHEGKELDIDTYVLGNALVTLGSINDSDGSEWETVIAAFTSERDRLTQVEADLQALAKRTMDRTVQLLQLGAVDGDGIGGEGYSLGVARVSLETIMEDNETDWQFVIEAFTIQRDRLAKIESDKQELRAKRMNELRPYLALIRDYEGVLSMNEATYQKELAEIVEADRLDREDKQRQQDRMQVANDRLSLLRTVEFHTSFVQVVDLTDVEFDALLKVKTNEFNAAKERQRITNLGLMRKPLLDAQGEIRSAEFLGNLSEDEFNAMLENAVRLKQQADQQRANEAAQAAIEAQRKVDEAKRIKDEENARKKAESATDKEKLEEMVKQIQAIVMPTCSSIQGDAIARGVIDRLNKIVGHMHEAMNNM